MKNVFFNLETHDIDIDTIYHNIRALGNGLSVTVELRFS